MSVWNDDDLSPDSMSETPLVYRPILLSVVAIFALELVASFFDLVGIAAADFQVAGSVSGQSFREGRPRNTVRSAPDRHPERVVLGIWRDSPCPRHLISCTPSSTDQRL